MDFSPLFDLLCSDFYQLTHSHTHTEPYTDILEGLPPPPPFLDDLLSHFVSILPVKEIYSLFGIS